MTTDEPSTLSWKGRVALVGFGLLLALLLLEGGLRLAGIAVQSGGTTEYLPSESSYLKEIRYKRDQTYEKYSDDTGPETPKRVVVIGDSFANGGNAFSNQTYPYFLHRYFEEAGQNVSVLNMGKCEDSTFGVETRLRDYLNAAKPDERPAVVAFIIGSADKYKLNAHTSSRDPAGHMPTLDVDWHDIEPAWYQDLRLYKLYRHINLGLSSRALVSDYAPREGATEETFEAMSGFYNRFRDNAVKHGWRHSEDTLYMPDTFDEENVRIGKDFGKIAPRYFSAVNVVEMTFVEELLNAIVIGSVVLYASKIRHADAVGVLLQLQDDFPLTFWSGPRLHYARYSLYQLYQLQSTHTPETILPRLERTLQAHPELADESRLIQFRETLESGERVDQIVDEKRLETWDRIVKLCQSKGVRMLLQNYPSDYRSANAIIQKVAEKYRLPMVDNHALFAGPAKEHGRNRYLEDDDHCTPEGYKMMAKAVFDRINEDRLLDWFSR